MAKGNKTGGRNFTKGTSGNPCGRPKIPDDIKELNNFNSVEFARICNDMFYMKSDDLEKVLQDRDEQVIRKIVAKTLKEALKTGDPKRVEFFLNRLIGKCPAQDQNVGLKISYHAEIMEMIREAEAESGAETSISSLAIPT